MTATLKAGGFAYDAWTSVSVKASLDSLAREFTVTYSGDEEAKSDELAEGQSCSIHDEGDQVLVNGWVDTVDEAYDDESQELACEGRSVTADLCDCSAETKGGQWRQATLRTIAEDVCGPFGIRVALGDFDLSATVRSFGIQEGETCHEALGRLARMHGFLWITSGRGELVATRTGQRSTSTVLEHGVNIISGSRHRSVAERFSSYSVVSQVRGEDDLSGPAAAHIRATIEDKTVGRHRPLRLVAEAEANLAGARDRAMWERAARAGRSDSLSYTVEDWNHASGLWEPGILVPVFDIKLRIDGTYLLRAVEFVETADDRMARLELVRPEAYDLRREPQKDRTRGEVLLKPRPEPSTNHRVAR